MAAFGYGEDVNVAKQVGAGLRQLSAFLKQADRSCTWGGLALVHLSQTVPPRTMSSSGNGSSTGDKQEVMWVCPKCLAGECDGGIKGAELEPAAVAPGAKGSGPAVAKADYDKVVARNRQLERECEALRQKVRMSHAFAVDCLTKYSSV